MLSNANAYHSYLGESIYSSIKPHITFSIKISHVSLDSNSYQKSVAKPSLQRSAVTLVHSSKSSSWKTTITNTVTTKISYRKLLIEAPASLRTTDLDHQLVLETRLVFQTCNKLKSVGCGNESDGVCWVVWGEKFVYMQLSVILSALLSLMICFFIEFDWLLF